MRFPPRIWYPIAAILCLANLVSVWFAARPAEPWHATAHAVLAVGLGLLGPAPQGPARRRGVGPLGLARPLAEGARRE